MGGAGEEAGKRREVKSDAELHAEAIAGGPEAFGPIVERYKDAVFGIALARVGDFHSAEDVAQGVLIAAFERLGSLKDPSRLGAWLRSMTIHQSIDHLRRRRTAADAHPAAPAAGDDRGPAARLERKELRERVLAAIGRLGRAQRETTTLFYIDGYSVAEVAAIQEVPVGTVKGRLHDARERLKAELLDMVEDVLKSEAPRDDLARRVFELISRRDRHEHEIMLELRRLGGAGAVDGFLRAFESPHPDTRQRALSLAAWFHAPENREQVAELLQRGLRDPSRQVRAGAIRAALERFACEAERKRTEFVPRVVELLFDPAKLVRRSASWALQHGWAADVPLESAARALLEETDPTTREWKEHLLRAVLDARGPDAARPGAPPGRRERLGELKEALGSESSSVRADAICRLLEPGAGDPQAAREAVALVAGMLTDRARRVRWRAAYELCAWAGDVPIDAVEKAFRTETHEGTRRQLQRLLQKATQQQSDTGI